MSELIKIQAELKAPKGQFNDFGKYKYRSAEDILEAVKPICHAHGCYVTLSDELVCVGERYYIRATATLWNKDNDPVNYVTAYAREEESKKGMDGSQVTGTSSSYARKYALNGLFAIDDTKDSDATNIGDTEPKTTEPKPNYFVCEECGNIITKSKKKSGELWEAADIAGYTKKKFGKQMCADCAKKGNK